MKDYISLALCKGLSPVRNLGRVRTRARLMNLLLAHRDRVRIIEAPAGFGKSSLASDYADTVFAFNRVFWFDCTSPCFVRDLDAGNLAECIFAVEPQTACVVFDDVPVLSAGRAALFAGAVRTLLAGGAEAIVCATPASALALADELGGPVAEPQDLLMDDGEWDVWFNASGLADVDDVHARILRIPGCSWGAMKGYDMEKAMLESLAGEDLPSFDAAVLTSALLWLTGTLDGLENAAGIAAPGEGELPLPLPALTSVALRYPYVAIDEETGVFVTPEASPKAIVRLLRASLERAAQHWGFGTANDLLSRSAAVMIEHGHGLRACDVALAIPQFSARAAWLERNQMALADDGLVGDVCRVFESIGSGLAKVPDAARLRLGQASRLYALGLAAEASEMAHTVAVSTSATRIEALLGRLLAWFGAPSEQEDAFRQGVEDAVAAVERSEGVAARRIPEVLLARVLLLDEAGAAPDGLTSLDLHRAWRQDIEVRREGRSLREGARASGHPEGSEPGSPIGCVSEDVACIFAAYRIALGMRASGHGPSGAAPTQVLGLRDYLLGQLTARKESLYSPSSRLETAAMMAMQALDALTSAGMAPADLPSALVAAYQRSATHLARECREAAKRTELLTETSAGMTGRGPKVRGGVQSVQVAVAPEVLHVRLFGALEVTRGDRVLDAKLFSRQKIKVLMAILTLNSGREVTREDLIAELWPGRFSDVATRSFYSVWGALRHNLADETGACPYLQRLQHGYRLEGMLVRSDVERVQEICRVFMLGRVDAVRWLELLEEFEDAYRGELLPSESESRLITATRVQCHRKAIDALIGASTRLLAEGEERIALLFAYAAIQREQQREDVYYALMRAQIACDQRTSAVETYQACKRMLAEELGMDPSRKMLDLYLGVISGDEAEMARAM